MDLDQWFKQIRQRYAAQIQCGKGCTACCYGLFDISLADALEVARGFGNLPAPLRERDLEQDYDRIGANEEARFP